MLVANASVAIKWFLLEPGRDEARRLLDAGQRLIAPELIVAEVTNGMWKRVMAGQMTARQGAAATTALQQFLEPLPPLPPLAARALAIAGELRHPACDCFYLALAKTRDLKLITADRRLVARLAGSPWQDRCLRLWN